MTTQIILPDQICDANGVPLAGAKARFYTHGTSTPVAVDDADGTPLGTFVTSDAAGRFPQVFTDALTGTDVEIETSGGTEIVTYAPAPETSTDPASANEMPYDPHADNAATNVQEAIDNINDDLYQISAAGFDLTAETTAAGMRDYLDAFYASPTDFTGSIPAITEGGVYPVTSATTGGWSGIANDDILLMMRTGANNGIALGFDASAVGTLPIVISRENAGVWGTWYTIPTLEYFTGRRFTSSAQTITAAGSLTIAHGLGAVPNAAKMGAWLVNVNTNLGYTTGHIVPISLGSTSSTSTNSFGVTVRPDATNLNVRFGASGFVLLHATTGVTTQITDSDWQIVFYAEL